MLQATYFRCFWNNATNGHGRLRPTGEHITPWISHSAPTNRPATTRIHLRFSALQQDNKRRSAELRRVPVCKDGGVNLGGGVTRNQSVIGPVTAFLGDCKATIRWPKAVNRPILEDGHRRSKSADFRSFGVSCFRITTDLRETLELSVRIWQKSVPSIAYPIDIVRCRGTRRSSIVVMRGDAKPYNALEYAGNILLS